MDDAQFVLGIVERIHKRSHPIQRYVFAEEFFDIWSIARQYLFCLLEISDTHPYSLAHVCRNSK